MFLGKLQDHSLLAAAVTAQLQNSFFHLIVLLLETRNKFFHFFILPGQLGDRHLQFIYGFFQCFLFMIPESAFAKASNHFSNFCFILVLFLGKLSLLRSLKCKLRLDAGYEQKF